MAIAGWTDEELLALFEEVIPWVSTTMRFTLIAFMKREVASAGEVKGTAGPSDAS